MVEGTGGFGGFKTTKKAEAQNVEVEEVKSKKSKEVNDKKQATDESSGKISFTGKVIEKVKDNFAEVASSFIIKTVTEDMLDEMKNTVKNNKKFAIWVVLILGVLYVVLDSFGGKNKKES